MDITNESKNNLTINTDARSLQDMTWEDANFTWDEASFPFELQETLESKNNLTITNDPKL